ncbi:MAG: hypothetical protein HY591_06685 [Candidatus Omnitrophica bacterium]|nr:hypothetical protein [Candidatus Omnitrophota bacterium]
MRALLILKNGEYGELRVMVHVHDPKLKERIISLLEKNRGKEALYLLKAKAEVDDYLPSGRKPSVMPQVTLIEDLL